LRRLALALAALMCGAGGALAKDPAAHAMFRWPLMGPVVKAGEGRGLDILAPEGEAVHAAGDGIVLYAGDELQSFGELILIRHADGYVSAYAYLSAMTVARGATVKRGDIIGKSGRSGDAPRPELHFELRKDQTWLDPIGYLAPR